MNKKYLVAPSLLAMLACTATTTTTTTTADITPYKTFLKNVKTATGEFKEAFNNMSDYDPDLFLDLPVIISRTSANTTVDGLTATTVTYKFDAATSAVNDDAAKIGARRKVVVPTSIDATITAATTKANIDASTVTAGTVYNATGATVADAAAAAAKIAGDFMLTVEQQLKIYKSLLVDLEAEAATASTDAKIVVKYVDSADAELVDIETTKPLAPTAVTAWVASAKNKKAELQAKADIMDGLAAGITPEGDIVA